MEEFFNLLFENAPPGTLFYGARIFKQVKRAYPKFYTEPSLLIADVKAHAENDQADFYFSPAFYLRRTKAIKSNVKGAGCAWVDCDAGLPDFDQEPNFVLETSPDHFHCYWLLGGMREPDEVEAINRTLAYAYNTDKSGWDATQLLRPPSSYNRKRDNFRTRIVRHNTDSLADFSDVDPGDYKPVDQRSVGGNGSGSVESLLAELVFTKRVRDLIFTATESKSGEGRSGLIFNTACELVKMKLKDAEILTLIEFQDLRLQKYVNHSDRTGTLLGVIKAARANEKTAEPLTKKPSFKVYTSGELLTVVSDERFLCQNLVFEEGIWVIGGEPGAGKSRFTLNLTDCLACGSPFLGFSTGDPIKCCYMTIEMSAKRLRGIRQQQLVGFKPAEQALINQNVTIIDVTPGTNLVDPESQQEATEVMLKVGAKFIVIDAVSLAIPDMSDDKQVVPFLSWIQGYIADTGSSFGFVTHTRKAQVGNKSANTINDWYGSRHWSITPDTGIVLESPEGQGKGGGAVLHINKDRSGELGARIEVKKDYDTSLYTLATPESQPVDKTGMTIKMGKIEAPI